MYIKSHKCLKLLVQKKTITHKFIMTLAFNFALFLIDIKCFWVRITIEF